MNVIAWGLSLERPTMIQYNVGNIRELFGHRVNLKYIKENPICCFKWHLLIKNYYIYSIFFGN